ncbi:SCO family protein [Flavobacterium tibetense]|uniref:SCO family protein n=1 Tax=Flavobacterium tibetense TaxID=2233533 RepID=A0A365P6C8_9FLAO|nr:SCO family protein [Flavobacterium tibetense]RBA29967.1 SCO family protein [Flavobacterium tibetense]
MLSFLKKYKIFLIVMSVLSVFIFSGIYTLLQPKKTLPIFTPRDVNPELVDTTIQHIGYNHTVADYKFVNQNGKTITEKDYEGKIYVADFFFTTCPTICPIMTDNMVWLQNEIKNMPNVMLLSHTVTPDIDSVPVLKAYAETKGVLDHKWNMVTGDIKDIFYMARTSYLVVKTGNPSELYDMVHTENFVLVDQKRRIRGFYDGTNLEEVKKLLEDIRFLDQK